MQFAPVPEADVAIDLVHNTQRELLEKVQPISGQGEQSTEGFDPEAVQATFGGQS